MFATSPWSPVSEVDQPPKTLPDLVGSEGSAIVSPITKFVPERVEPPFESQMTLFWVLLQTAYKMVSCLKSKEPPSEKSAVLALEFRFQPKKV